MTNLFHANLPNGLGDGRFGSRLHAALADVQTYLRSSITAAEQARFRLRWRKVRAEHVPQHLPRGRGVWCELDDAEDVGGESVALAEVFERDVERLYDGTGKDDFVKIVRRATDEGLVCLEHHPRRDWVEVRPNTYNLSRQQKAAYDLKDRPQEAHVGLLRLFQIEQHAHWPYVEPEEITRWHLLTKPDRPGTDEQRRFVEKALGTPDFAILNGPAGSGKTTAICEIVLQAVARGWRVLVCASTHVAVDNVLERLELIDGDVAREVLAVRIGTADRVSESVHGRLLDELVRTEREQLLRALEKRPKAERSSAQEILLAGLRAEKSDVLERVLLDAANVVCGTTIGILKHPEINAKRGHHLAQPPLYDLMILDEASKTTFAEFLVPAMLARRWILVGDPKQLAPFVDAGEMGAAIEQSFDAKFRTIARAARDTFLLAGREANGVAGALVVGVDDEDTLDAYTSEAEARGLTFADLDPETEDPGVEVAHARIVVGTPDAIVAESARLPIDTIIVKGDDPELEAIRRRAAAMAARLGFEDGGRRWGGELAWRLTRSHETRSSRTEGQVDRYIEGAKGLIPQAATLELLEAVPRKPEDVWDQVDRMRRVALPSILDILLTGMERGRPGPATALTTGLPVHALAQRYELLTYQHRMHPELSRLPREIVYAGEALRDPDDMAAQRAWRCRLWSARLAWVDVHAPRRGPGVEQEARAAAGELRRFVEWAAHERPDHGGNWEIAVLTFYRAQERLLRAELQRSARKGSHSRFEVAGAVIQLCTVDRFQGHEADVVILSMGRSDKIGFLDSLSRMNVALTRARYQLVVVGRRDTFRNPRAPLLHALAGTEPRAHSLES